MTQRPSLLLSASLLFLLALSSPGLACMEHEEMFEPMEEEANPDSEDMALLPFAVESEPRDDLECDTDLGCPSGMICEPVSCCEAEDCDCPVAVCVWSDTGAQGRDCETSDDCGSGYRCDLSDAQECDDSFAEACTAAPIGWCDADASRSRTNMPYPREDADAVTGCQGGSDQSLPLLLALALMATTLSRRPRLS
jgi:hypothetical protein